MQELILVHSLELMVLLEFILHEILILLIIDISLYLIKINCVEKLGKALVVLDTISIIFILKNIIDNYPYIEIGNNMISDLSIGMFLGSIFFTCIDYKKVKQDISIYQVIQKSGFLLIFLGNYNHLEKIQKDRLIEKLKLIFMKREYKSCFRYALCLRDKKEVFLMFAFPEKSDYELFLRELPKEIIEEVEEENNGVICQMKIKIAD